MPWGEEGRLESFEIRAENFGNASYKFGVKRGSEQGSCHMPPVPERGRNRQPIEMGLRMEGPKKNEGRGGVTGYKNGSQKETEVYNRAGKGEPQESAQDVQ